MEASILNILSLTYLVYMFSKYLEPHKENIRFAWSMTIKYHRNGRLVSNLAICSQFYGKSLP